MQYQSQGGDFQTIESILKLSMDKFEEFKEFAFPDYWVYFKALLNNYHNPSRTTFPDYWVYFKAGVEQNFISMISEYFQTIESILKRVGWPLGNETILCISRLLSLF